MIKLRAILGRFLADPYATGVLGLLLLTRSLDGLAAQARQVSEQLAAVQAQAQVTLQGARTAGVYEAAAQAQANGVGVYPDAEAPPVDVAGEHEDLHP